MKSILMILVTLGLLISCQPKKHAANFDDLIKADLSFSGFSADSGFAKAFIAFAHPAAVLLRDNTMPIKGSQAISSLYGKSKNSLLKLTWEPLDGTISASGDLGYTYGIYTAATDSLSEKGTYVTIWKKDESGKWKYILDTGNEGIGK